MNEDKKFALQLFGIVVLLIILICGVIGCAKETKQEEVSEVKLEISDRVVTEQDRLLELCKKDGYEDLQEWSKALDALKEEFKGSADQAVENYGEYLSEEQIAFLHEYEDHILEAQSIAEIDKWKEWFNQIIVIGEEAKTAEEQAAWEAEQVYYDYSYDYNYDYSPSYDTSDSGLTAYTGVNYHDGRTETYYSSNVAYHYRTNEWTVDDEGFYRTDEGYYVVATSDMEQGTTFEGSKGTCIVLDCGCDDGVTDYYVNW